MFGRRKDKALEKQVEDAEACLHETEAKDAEVESVRDSLNRQIRANHLSPRVQAAFALRHNTHRRWRR